ncbi:MAG TPA: Maf family protein [Candidatus Acidoferrales bacterium]|nr:Maf family protein [Candidatus Acidoferrales bacterium]
MKIILASISPRRAEILRNAGFNFDILPSEVDESVRPRESAADYVRRLAEEKARAAAQTLASNRKADAAVIVAADATVVLDGEILGKPSSADDARDMLRRLSGRTHEVLTGLAVLSLQSREIQLAVESTCVTFAKMTEAEIEDYVASGEPFDKAGAYAIQARGGKFITRIEGCYFNVMGLPLARFYSILREMQQKCD